MSVPALRPSLAPAGSKPAAARPGPSRARRSVWRGRACEQACRGRCCCAHPSQGIDSIRNRGLPFLSSARPAMGRSCPSWMRAGVLLPHPSIPLEVTRPRSEVVLRTDRQSTPTSDPGAARPESAETLYGLELDSDPLVHVRVSESDVGSDAPDCLAEEPRYPAHLLFLLTAIAAAGMAFFELRMMWAQTPEEYSDAVRWVHGTSALNLGPIVRRV